MSRRGGSHALDMKSTNAGGVAGLGGGSGSSVDFESEIIGPSLAGTKPPRCNLGDWAGYGGLGPFPTVGATSGWVPEIRCVAAQRVLPAWPRGRHRSTVGSPRRSRGTAPLPPIRR